MNSVYENVAKQFVNMTYTGIGNSDTSDLVISKLVIPSWKFHLHHFFSLQSRNRRVRRRSRLDESEM